MAQLKKQATPAQVFSGWASAARIPMAEMNFRTFWETTRPRRGDMTAEAESKRVARRAIEDLALERQQREVWEQPS